MAENEGAADVSDSASPPEPEYPIYKALCEQASSKGIDISGESDGSLLLYGLLHAIRDLETVRSVWNQFLLGEKPGAIDTPADGDLHKVWELISGREAFSLGLDLRNYDGSAHGAFYSQLLDVRTKLRYEIDAIGFLFEKTHGSEGGKGVEERPLRIIRRDSSEGPTVEDVEDEPRYRTRSFERRRSTRYDNDDEDTGEQFVRVIDRKSSYADESSESPESSYDDSRYVVRRSERKPSTRYEDSEITAQPPHAPPVKYYSASEKSEDDLGQARRIERERVVVRERNRPPPPAPFRRRRVASRTGSEESSRLRLQDDVQAAPIDTVSSDEESEGPDWVLLDGAIDTSRAGVRTRQTIQPRAINEVFYAKRHLGRAGKAPLGGRFSIRSNLKRHPRIAFVLHREYDCFFTGGPDDEGYSMKPCLWRTIIPISETLRRAIEPFLRLKKHILVTTMLWSLAFFHCRKQIVESLDGMEPYTRAEVQLLLDATKEEFDEATALFEKGMVSPAHLPKLFSWKQVLVIPGDTVETLQCENLPLEFEPQRASVEVSATRWAFDGKFHLIMQAMDIRSSHQATKIRNLKIYPLSFATPEIQALVASRGRTFWLCRRKAFISYTASGQIQRSQGPGNYRFMIDYDTYRELHPDADEFKTLMDDPVKTMDDAAMNADEPPGAGQELIFPSSISGYSIQDKKWKSLQVDFISPIIWNKLAFERLVLKPVAKELIQAVVQNNDGPDQSADLMQGKGNGSLILLHGPPGTGKTLTAESVAELVQRPLYRVTCGDVGTDPESVESYLESVLYIGKIWGCVVLLDEADVFLEERTLTDLHRNALVSVFLRVLEYYDGILILTSNRVGTFDEAFKSRIKLALHYSALGKADRRKIWRNFFKTLKETDPEHVDFDDLDDHLDDLAEVVLNGRDIRNAISMARELAKFRKDERLDYHHLQHVIGVAEDFERYLDKTHGHKTDDWLKENGIRA